jgi:hypothetical protein
MLSLALCLLFLLLPTTPAAAVNCPGQANFDFLYEEWTPGSPPAGFRASIVLRKGSHSGSVCDPVGHSDTWVAIQSDTEIAISQIGWTHDFVRGYCRFSEWFTEGTFNPPILDRCGTDSDGDARLFKIQKWFNPDESQYYFGIYDCAASDWSTCTLRDGGAPESELPSAFGEVVAETNFGGTACTNDFMGSANYRVRFGETDDAIKGQASVGGSWGVKSLTYVDDSPCTHYDSDEHTDEVFRTFDDRN